MQCCFILVHNRKQHYRYLTHTCVPDILIKNDEIIFQVEYKFRGVLYSYLLQILNFWVQEFIQNIDQQIVLEMPNWMFFIKYMKQEFHIFKFTNSIFLNYSWKICHVYVYWILYQVRLYATRQATSEFRIYRTLWGHLNWRITLTWVRVVVRDTETVKENSRNCL